jgi:hypothetical protein
MPGFCVDELRFYIQCLLHLKGQCHEMVVEIKTMEWYIRLRPNLMVANISSI